MSTPSPLARSYPLDRMKQPPFRRRARSGLSKSHLPAPTCKRSDRVSDREVVVWSLAYDVRSGVLRSWGAGSRVASGSVCGRRLDPMSTEPSRWRFRRPICPLSSPPRTHLCAPMKIRRCPYFWPAEPGAKWRLGWMPAAAVYFSLPRDHQPRVPPTTRAPFCAFMSSFPSLWNRLCPLFRLARLHARGLAPSWFRRIRCPVGHSRSVDLHEMSSCFLAPAPLLLNPFFFEGG